VKPGTYHVAMTMEKMPMILTLTMIENVDEVMILDITAVTGWQSY
jgi:hypothetical protein